jgi:signal transduction histidine kinase
MRIWPTRLSLSSRFLLALTLLLTLLVTAILFIIGRREVNIIFEESRNRGVLIARHIASLNIEPLTFWETDTIKKNIDGQIDADLVYVMFYDRFTAPLVWTDFLQGRRDITCCSHLPETVDESTTHFEAKVLLEGKRKLHILEVEMPVFAKGSTVKWGSIKIGLSLDDMRTEVAKTGLMLILIGLIGLSVGISGAALLVRGITRPIQRLAAGTIRVSRGDFSHKIQVESKDEIGDLARSFNQMSSKLLAAQHQMEGASKRLVQVEKLASIGRMAATIAHEIRNPLTSVKLNIQKVSLAESLDETEREHLKIAQEGTGHIERFIKELLNFTRASELNLNPFALEQIVEESIKLLRDTSPEKSIALEREYEPGLPEVLVDGDKLRQVISNVLRNAYEAIETKGRVKVQLLQTEVEGRAFVRLRVSDDGLGIPDKDSENIFEPFFTTKPSGVGLGLANARKILEQHGGAIRVVKGEGRGATFEILLPVKGVL